jgi:integrase/recombinase XerD
MFDKVFHYKWFADELVRGPLEPYVNEIARELFDRGHSRRKVRQKFVVLGQLSQWMRRRKLVAKDLNNDIVDRFISAESKRVVYPLSDRGDLNTIKLLRNILFERNILVSPPLNPRGELIKEFEGFLANERGISRPAIYSYARYADLFIGEVFDKRDLNWDNITSDCIYQFILRRSRQWSPGTNKFVVTGLRSFFRFLKMRGYCQIDLASGVPRVPLWKARNLPYYLDPGEVEKLLAAIDRATSRGKRNYAIVLVLARLGVRACELANLTLDDLDWTNGEIVFRGKGVRGKRLPISKEIGDAMVQYIRVRQKNARSRKLFLRSFPPYDGITKSLIGIIVRDALSQAKIKAFKRGSHLLRHTAATQMLKSGASLPEIGTILGHASVQSTAIYAKVDFESLRPIVRPWPIEKITGGAQ